MYEKVNNIHQLSVYAGEAEKNNYGVGQWLRKFDEWLAGEIDQTVVQRTSQWIFREILTQKQKAPYDVMDGILSKGLPIDLDLGTLVDADMAHRALGLVGAKYVPRYIELQRHPASAAMYVALAWLLGRTSQPFDITARHLSTSKWVEFDEIFLTSLKKRHNGEGMDYSNFVLATISLLCWRYVETNRDLADGIYNNYFRFVNECKTEVETEVAVESDNERTVGTIVEKPCDGTVKIRGIGTPEITVEVEPLREAWKVMEPDMGGAEIAHNLDFYLSRPRVHWRKNAAIELTKLDSFSTIEQSIDHIFFDLVVQREVSASEFLERMRRCGFYNPEIIFSSGTFHGKKATYWLTRLANHFKIDVPVPLHGLEAELYIALCLLFEARHRNCSVGKESRPFLELIELVAPRSDVIYNEAYDYVMLHALCGCVALIGANGPVAAEIYRKHIGFTWEDFPMGGVVEDKPEPKVLITKDDVALGNPPETKMQIRKEGRREAGVEPETHATLIGNVEQQADQLVEAMAFKPKPNSITITLNPDEDTDETIAKLLAGFRDRKGFGHPVADSFFAPVKRKKRGWLTGKFCMLHMGHINFIHQAATQCDELVVVLSHSDKRFKDPRLSYRNKMLWLRTTFKNEPHITVVGVDESNVPEYPNGWQAWSDLVKEKIGTDFDYIFTSEICDHSGYNTHFPGQEVVVVDSERKGVDISATKIRGDMVQYWGMMPTVVRKDFVMRICIVGTESCGKSTLTKMLAKRHQTSWVEEYGRTYCEQDLCMDEDLLVFDDYGTIAARRYDMEQEAAASANRVLFVDTAALSTNYFSLLYNGRENQMVSAYQERERYDAYFYLTDDVPFVEDGLRKNRNRDNTRFLFERMLFANAKRHGSEVFVISGNYKERFNKAIEIVDELLARPLSID